MKIRSTALLVTCSVLTLNGCISIGGEETSTKPIEKQVEINVITDAEGAQLKYIGDVRKAFEAANPNIKINLSLMKDRKAIEKKVNSEQPPDIVPLGASNFKSYVTQGVVSDLVPYMKADKINVDEYYKGAIEALSDKGKLSGLPLGLHTMAVYYNKKTFDDHQIPYPIDGWTWDTFVETARKLSQQKTENGKEKYGVYIPLDVEIFEAFVYANKGRYVSPDGSTAKGYVDGKASIDAYKKLIDLFRVHQAASPPKQGGLDPIKSGDVAMKIEFDFMAGAIKKDDPIGVVGLPTFNANDRSNVLYMDGYGILEKSAHKKEAWKFLRFLALPDEQTAKLWTTGQLAPTVKIGKMSGQADSPIWNVFINELQYAKRGAFYDNEAWNAMRKSQNEDLEKMIRDGVDIQQTLTKWADEYERTVRK